MARSNIIGPPFSLALCLLTTVLAGCKAQSERPKTEASSQPAPSAPPATNNHAASAQPQASDDGEWHIPAKDFASTRFSGLDQITTSRSAHTLQASRPTSLRISFAGCRTPNRSSLARPCRTSE
jgi:glucose dehydrogenase